MAFAIDRALVISLSSLLAIAAIASFTILVTIEKNLVVKSEPHFLLRTQLYSDVCRLPAFFINISDEMMLIQKGCTFKSGFSSIDATAYW